MRAASHGFSPMGLCLTRIYPPIDGGASCDLRQMTSPGHSALPGFAPALAIILAWVSLIVLLPLAALALSPWELGLSGV